ncbi:MAG TPA: aromatic ring-hydroxylating dioxygenase subunit alpha [Caulobacteraceae bacterium]|jgi:phenylpropionate dioxygenase-like ring-hydroxylating dioxygenase large terminal subunit
MAADADQDLSPRAADIAFGRGFLRDTWWFAALGSDLKTGDLKRYEILGEPVLLGRTRKGAVFALRDICPHRAAPLSAGRLVADPKTGEAVECCYHGWRFGTDGVCSAIPSLVDGQAFEPERVKVRAYPVRESQGLIFVWIASDPRNPLAPDYAPPQFPGVVGGKPKLVDGMDFEAHVDHAIVGLMDPAHGPYVHQQWWWRSTKSAHEKAKAFEPREHGFAMARHPPSKNSRAYAALGGEPLTEITFALPAFRWEHILVGKRQVLSLTCLTPVTESKTRITQILWSDHPVVSLILPFVRAGARAFLRQDGDMVNLQNEGLKYDPPLLWVDDADRQAKWYQALKKEWATSRKEGRPFVNPVKAATLRWKS